MTVGFATEKQAGGSLDPQDFMLDMLTRAQLEELATQPMGRAMRRKIEQRLKTKKPRHPVKEGRA